MASKSTSKSSTVIIVKGPVKFPEKCVVCGRASHAETVLISGQPYGFWFGVWRWLFGMTPKIAVPAHKACGNTLKTNLLWRNIQLLFLATIAIVVALIVVENFLDTTNFIPDRIVFYLIVTAVLVPLAIWQTHNPLPVEFIEDDDNLCFEFRDSTYASEFAALNKVVTEDMSE